jgi:AraC family transcriptional regulator
MRHQVACVPGFTLMSGTHQEGARLPRHSHDDPSLCYVFRGRFTEYSRGNTAECATDTLKLTPAGETHWNRFVAGETRGLRVDIDRSRFAASPAIDRVLGERVHIDGFGARGVMRRISAELQQDDDVSRLAIEGLLLELLAGLARESLPQRGPRLPEWLRRADAIVRELYATRVALGDVAEAVGVAPATLARGYRAVFHLTVGERVRRLRIERAARELMATDSPLSMVALQAGFYDQSHFTNAFRRQMGVTPGEYRRRMQ